MNGLMDFLTANCCAGDAAQCRVPVCDPGAAILSSRAPSKGADR
jgi:hypothetical protein